MSKTAKTSTRVAALKAWMAENKIPKVKLTTTQPINYGRDI